MDPDRSALRQALGRPLVPPYAVWFVFASVLLKDGFSLLMLLAYGVTLALLVLVLQGTAGASAEARRYGLFAVGATGVAIGGEIGFLSGASRGLVLWSLVVVVVVRDRVGGGVHGDRGDCGGRCRAGDPPRRRSDGACRGRASC